MSVMALANSVNSVKPPERDNTEPSFWAKCLKEGVEIKLENSPVKVARKMLLGTIMGDASLRRPHNTGNKASFRVTHSASQLPYLLWKAKKVAPLVGTLRAYIWDTKWTPEGGFKVTLSSHCSKFLGHLYDDFYRREDGENKKVLRSNVLNRLTPLSLAIFYADDGTPFFRYQEQERLLVGFELCTQGFTSEEVDLLIDTLKKKFGVLFRKRKVATTQGERYAIRTCCLEDRDIFLMLVKPYLWEVECLRYKLDSQFKKFSSYSAEGLEKYLRDHDMIHGVTNAIH